MIGCEIFEARKNDEPVRIGTNAWSLFSFNTIPRLGDTLWLQYKDGAGEFTQRACVVTFSAQWCSDTVEYNKGYLEIEFI